MAKKPNATFSHIHSCAEPKTSPEGAARYMKIVFMPTHLALSACMSVNRQSKALLGGHRGGIQLSRENGARTHGISAVRTGFSQRDAGAVKSAS